MTCACGNWVEMHMQRAEQISACGGGNIESLMTAKLSKLSNCRTKKLIKNQEQELRTSSYKHNFAVFCLVQLSFRGIFARTRSFSRHICSYEADLSARTRLNPPRTRSFSRVICVRPVLFSRFNPMRHFDTISSYNDHIIII